MTLAPCAAQTRFVIFFFRLFVFSSLVIGFRCLLCQQDIFSLTFSLRENDEDAMMTKKTIEKEKKEKKKDENDDFCVICFFVLIAFVCIYYIIMMMFIVIHCHCSC